MLIHCLSVCLISAVAVQDTRQSQVDASWKAYNAGDTKNAFGDRRAKRTHLGGLIGA